MSPERRGRAIRDRVALEPLRKPPFNIAAVDEARILARKAQDQHERADAVQVPWEMRDGAQVFDAQSPEASEREALRRRACALDQQADALVPVEYRGGP